MLRTHGLFVPSLDTEGQGGALYLRGGDAKILFVEKKKEKKETLY